MNDQEYAVTVISIWGALALFGFFIACIINFFSNGN